MSIVRTCIRALLPLCAIALFVGCSSDGPIVDEAPATASDDDEPSGHIKDAGRDAGRKDAGRKDAGTDASSKDAGNADDVPSADDDDAGRLAPMEDAGQADADKPEPARECLAPYVAAVKTPLRLCRTCHYKGGAGEDARFLLTTDPAQDEAKLKEAYAVLGNDLLAVPAQENGNLHSGGMRFTKGTADYKAWSALMDALADPVAACTNAP